MHVLDLKPFQVGLGHIGLIGHHGVKLVWPFLLIILFQALNTRRAKGERHHKDGHTKNMQASIASFNWSP